MPSYPADVKPLSKPRGITYILSCRWGNTSDAICWFNESHEPVGHVLNGTQGILSSLEPIVKTATMSFYYDDVNENYLSFVPPHIKVEFSWVDRDGNVIADAGRYSQGGASQSAGLGWFLQDGITGHYGTNAPVTAELPVVNIVAPEFGAARPAGLRQVTTINPGTVSLSATAGILKGTIWLGRPY